MWDDCVNEKTGSVNGARFGYFLMQHKEELGIKYISHVTIFSTEELGVECPSESVGWDMLCLAFHVAPELPVPTDSSSVKKENGDCH